MENKLKFVNENHKNNYKEILKKFTKKLSKDLDTVLKLLSIEEVYDVAQEYISDVGVNFSGILSDSRVRNTNLFIVELAYTFYKRTFEVKDISSTRKLDMDTRNFIISLLNLYTPKIAIN